MDYKKEIIDFLKDDELRLNLDNKRLYIMNYEEIKHFDFNEIIISGSGKEIVVKGNDLIISKLLKKELAITGEISIIEFR